MKFKLYSPFSPQGDQSKAIESLCDGLEQGEKYQTLKGVTGSGKTYTMANVIERMQRPTLIVSHNKTLAAQLYREFKEFFPENKVEYFVSYYDYYQPESYVPSRDLYIEKEVLINDQIELMRMSSIESLIEHRDTIVIATVSCIYGIGEPEEYKSGRLRLAVGELVDLEELKKKLVYLQYERTDESIVKPGQFRVQGDLVDIFPPYTDEAFYRIELDFEELASIKILKYMSEKPISIEKEIHIYPKSLFTVSKDKLNIAIERILNEMEEYSKDLLEKGKNEIENRIRKRTLFDVEMIKETGYCKGIENYSRHLYGRNPGDTPSTLFNCFPKDYLLFVDESHVTLSQFRAMYLGDKARKDNLIEYGFRLPSAYDNRPLLYNEFEKHIKQAIFVSATPGNEEMEKSTKVVEQIIRPTGLLDPIIEVRRTDSQMEDIYGEIRQRIEKNERIIITTLTKKMAEELTDYLLSLNIKTRYIHSEIDTLERVDILKDFRLGIFEVLVGINLLREGIDLPEVSLIVILDADKIGFLRSKTSLIQIIGRAARNENGKVIMYADRMSDAMRAAIDETRERRARQEEFNKEHNIVPKTIVKAIKDILEKREEKIETEGAAQIDSIEKNFNLASKKDRNKLIKILKKKMDEHSIHWEFEKAIRVRERIKELESM